MRRNEYGSEYQPEPSEIPFRMTKDQAQMTKSSLCFVIGYWNFICHLDLVLCHCFAVVISFVPSLLGGSVPRLEAGFQASAKSLRRSKSGPEKSGSLNA